MGLTSRAEVAILGGGVAGLACAMRLHSADPSLSVTILEGDAQPGGKVRGERVHECIVDGGPDLCVEWKLARTHAYARLGIASELLPVNPEGLPTYRRLAGELTEIDHVLTDGLVTMRSGMHDMVRRMVESIPGVGMMLGAAVTVVERTGQGWRISTSDGSRVEAEMLACALPARNAGALLGATLPSLALAAERVSYVPITTVSAAWTRSSVRHAMRGTGFIESDARPGTMSACTWTSSKIPGRAPSDLVLVRGYVRSSNVAEATAVAIEDIRSTLGIASDPLWTKSFSWVDAIPGYPQDHVARSEELRRGLESVGGIAIAGAAWDGVGLGDCIASGERAADYLLATAVAGGAR